MVDISGDSSNSGSCVSIRGLELAQGFLGSENVKVPSKLVQKRSCVRLGSEKDIIGVCRMCVSSENKRFRIVAGWWRVGIV